MDGVDLHRLKMQHSILRILTSRLPLLQHYLQKVVAEAVTSEITGKKTSDGIQFLSENYDCWTNNVFYFNRVDHSANLSCNQEYCGQGKYLHLLWRKIYQVSRQPEPFLC